MKKLFAAVLLTTISSFAFAEPFSVSSSYDVAQTLSGAIEFSVDEGKTASFSGGYIKEFSVTVTPGNEDQVILTYHFVADTVSQPFFINVKRHPSEDVLQYGFR